MQLCSGAVSYSSGFEIHAALVCVCYLLCQFIQHAGADRRGVCAEDVLLGLLQLPVVLVPAGQTPRPSLKHAVRVGLGGVYLYSVCVYVLLTLVTRSLPRCGPV